MHKTWKENVTDKIRRKMRIHRYFKLPYQLALIIVTIIGDTCEYLVHNSKRISSIAAVFLFFIISSSFAFPYIQEEDYTEEAIRMQEIESSYEYVPTVLDLSANDVLDDNDVLDGYNNEELDIQDGIDQFSLDDILEANEISNTNNTDSQSQEQELTADDWRLLLVNKQHPVPDDYTLAKLTIIWIKDILIWKHTKYRLLQ